MRKIRVAMVGFGEINTPRELIERKCREARGVLESQGLEVLWTEPVRDDPQGEEVARAKAELAGKEFDLLVICIAGWIPSHAVIAVIDVFRHKPMLLWGLTGSMEGNRFVTTADQAGTTALRKPMHDLGYVFKYVVNRYGAPPDLGKIVGFANAARAASLLRGARIGQMGYRDMRLYGTMFDGVSLRATIGPEVEFFEMLEMVQASDALPAGEVATLAERVRQRWRFLKPPAEGTVEKAVRLYLAIKAKIAERGYEAISLIDVDGVKKLLKFAPAGVFMLVHEEDHICTIPENDTLGSVTQLITRYLTGQVGAYLEFYEFLDDGMLMGVPDYVPSEVVDGSVTVLPTAFGEFGEGLLNVSKLKTGPVTLARLTSTGNRYQMHLATGNAVTPRAWEEAGWAPPAPQLPSLEIKLDGDVDDFLQKVAGQHYIISYGDKPPGLRRSLPDPQRGSHLIPASSRTTMASPTPATSPMPADAPRLKRVLTVKDLIFYGIILITPIAPLSVFGLSSKMSQGHVSTTIVIAMVAMMLTAFSYGRMAALYPSAGSAYTFVSRGLGPHLGFLAGWAMFLDYLVIPVVNTVIGTQALAEMVPVVPYTVWVILFVALITILNLRGIHTTARANIILLVVMTVVIVGISGCLDSLSGGRGRLGESFLHHALLQSGHLRSVGPGHRHPPWQP